jgi:ribosomal protein S27E
VSPAGVQIVFSRPTQHGVHGACGKVLGAGETCKLYLQIKIKRATSGAFTANLLIGKPASTLPLTGTIGGLSFFPSPLDFGSVQPGVFSATKMVKVKNTSSQTISLAKLSVGSVSPAGVQIVFSRPTQHGVHGACGKVLGAGETCKLYLQIKIKTKRATSGAFTANLLIGKPASTLPLTGTIRRSRTH